MLTNQFRFFFITTAVGIGNWIRQVHIKCVIDRLGTGWSMHTTETGSLTRSSQLTFEEQEHIMRVIRQAELVEHTEMERIGSESLLCWLLTFCIAVLPTEIQEWNWTALCNYFVTYLSHFLCVCCWLLSPGLMKKFWTNFHEMFAYEQPCDGNICLDFAGDVVWLLLPWDTQTPGHRWLHYRSTWQSLASAKTQSLHQAQNIHLSCAVSSVIWFWNVDNAQSRQWQDPVFSHAGTASYP